MMTSQLLDTLLIRQMEIDQFCDGVDQVHPLLLGGPFTCSLTAPTTAVPFGGEQSDQAGGQETDDEPYDRALLVGEVTGDH
jgi:hypothetical protein